MEFLWFFAALIICIFLLLRKRKNFISDGERGLDLATNWLHNNGIDRTKVRFFSYKNDLLVSTDDATCIVGSSVKNNGTRTGFVVETLPNVGVIRGALVDTTSASFHSTLSQVAISKGIPLMDAIIEENKLRKNRGLVRD